MTPLQTDAVLAAAGCGAGVPNAVAGGGTFLTLPALILAGIPPVAANATSAIAVLPGYLGSAWGFRRDIADVGRPLLVRMTCVSLAGGLAGAALLLVTSNSAFIRVVHVVRRPPAGVLRRRLMDARRGSACGRRIGVQQLRLWVAAPVRRREHRTVDGSLASTRIERLLSGFRPRERSTAYVRSTS